MSSNHPRPYRSNRSSAMTSTPVARPLRDGSNRLPSSSLVPSTNKRDRSSREQTAVTRPSRTRRPAAPPSASAIQGRAHQPREQPPDHRQEPLASRRHEEQRKEADDDDATETDKSVKSSPVPSTASSSNSAHDDDAVPLDVSSSSSSSLASLSANLSRSTVGEVTGSNTPPFITTTTTTRDEENSNPSPMVVQSSRIMDQTRLGPSNNAGYDHGSTPVLMEMGVVDAPPSMAADDTESPTGADPDAEAEALAQTMQANLARIAAQQDNVDWKKTQIELDQLFKKNKKIQFENVPIIDMPSQFRDKGVTLFDHQEQGIRWLVHKETTNTSIPPFWKEVLLGANKDIKWYRCSLTHKYIKNRPEPIRGSILADDMGLGKSLQSIGLILSNPPPGRDGVVRPYPYNKSMGGRRGPLPPRCTLIVSPVSVMGNWKLEIAKFTTKGLLKVEIYHGPNRDQVLQKANKGDLDIMICSYQTLVADLKKRNVEEEDEEEKQDTHSDKSKSDDGSDDDGHWDPDSDDDDSDDDDHWGRPSKKQRVPDFYIFDLEFHRIILDEAHTARNGKASVFEAVMNLEAKNKLCLTGTPFVNRPSDLHSLFSFLEVKPLNSEAVFNYNVVQPILEKKEVGLSRLRVCMGEIALRRTKADVESTVQMVAKTVEVREVNFSPGFHGDTNKMLYETCRSAFIGLLKSGGGLVYRKAFALFALVLRVRQACCHAGMIPSDTLEKVRGIHRKLQKLDMDNIGQEEGLQLFEDLVAVFSKKQKEGAQYSDGSKTARGGQHVGDVGRAPKIQALLDAIGQMGAGEKGVVFSQWTSYLDIIQAELAAEGHHTTRIDGSMNAVQRLEAMERFGTEGCSSKETPRFILCSLHACGVGVTLTRGNWVFMMDTWWNVAVEQQAIDRVHRIGQCRPVSAIRLIMKDSIEQRFLNLQSAKECLGKGSLQKLGLEDRKKARITAMKDLFEVGESIVQWDGDYADDEQSDDEEDSDLDGFIVEG